MKSRILKEIRKENNIIDNKELENLNHLEAFKNKNHNYRKIEKIIKNNLPELKLSKIKSRIDSEINTNYKSINLSNINIKNINDIQNKIIFINNKQKNNSSSKKNCIVFPKIENILKKNKIYKKYEKFNNNNFNNSFNENNFKDKNNNHNIKNNCNLIINKFQNNSIKDFDNNEINEMNKLKHKKNKYNNEIPEFHRIKLKKSKNNCFSKVIKNINSIKNNEKFPHYLLIEPPNKNNKSHISVPILNLSSSQNNNNENYINNSKINTNENNTKLFNNISTIKTLKNNINQSLSAKNINFMENEIKELENITEKLNKMNCMLNRLSPLSSTSSSALINKNIILNNLNLQTSKTLNISPDILKKSFPNYEESITSYYIDLSKEKNSIIKGYAYNTSKGNIRNYNEDTITVEKIKLNNNETKEDNYFYFFGIYDGHGGNGCSLYLKDNLHKHIKEFSIKGIKEAINESENEFLNKKAIDENNKVIDTSGSCAIIAMIQNNKLIISNTGDSRIVIYKNKKIFFVTEDHKPNSPKEKDRIKNAGGQIYQNQTIIPIYQNGKKVELPWRVIPGKLSVSRTIGDIEAKDEKYGGKKGVIMSMPDVTEMEINNEFDFMIIGCDGIFDVLSNEDFFDIWNIVLNKYNNKNISNIEFNNNIDELCGDFSGLIIKSALAKNSFDNVSCIVIVFNIKC